MICMSHFRQTTLTAGLEALLDLRPLDLYIQSSAVQTSLRICDRNPRRWDGRGKGNSRGHLHWSYNILQILGLDTCQIDSKMGRHLEKKSDSQSTKFQGEL